MVENMLIIEGDAYVADYMTKITKGYSSDKYAVMEFIYNLFKYGKSKDCNLGQDLYSVIEEYIEEKLDKYPKLKELELYKTRCVGKLYDIVCEVLPRDILQGDNIFTLNEIYYTLDGQIYKFNANSDEEQSLALLSENFDSIYTLFDY